MKLRFAVPLTLALLILTSWLSGPLRINVYYVLVAITAVWCAVDSRRISIRRFNTQLALPPVALAAVVAVAWPLAFPLYLRTRHRILSGQIAEGRFEGNTRVLVWIAGILALIAVPGFLVTRNVRRTLMPVAAAINQAFGIPVNVSRNQTRLVVTVPFGAASDSTRQQFALDVASCAMKHYTEFVSTIEVQYAEVTQRGAMTMTRTFPGGRWGVNAITPGCPDPATNAAGIPQQ